MATGSGLATGAGSGALLINKDWQPLNSKIAIKLVMSEKRNDKENMGKLYEVIIQN